MVTHNEYLKNILSHVLDSYDFLKEINDNPGDLEVIKKELLKINGFIKVMTNNIDSDKIQSSDFKPLKSKFRHYLENYFFEKEIETMSPLYSNDLHRVKNMRLKILESLEDKKMINDVKELFERI
ncbi:hypothetical protein BD31_I1226 [Candidatus Nitrosopumilus salaria BD31]|uniref:Uncharacterized protein n=1 Tax=Candidatus Nitrosopumilus salarius BD31 TaxID=859350 RepID=I3D4U4_9ARCH|nr:hypothetical protein [Candidatus Nitrosopumilus salaria]EIJ66737.1 hypothetical protein BD31_I1226 [Candidatus Nitrosopumilus salaria BD31]